MNFAFPVVIVAFVFAVVVTRLSYFDGSYHMSARVFVDQVMKAPTLIVVTNMITCHRGRHMGLLHSAVLLVVLTVVIVTRLSQFDDIYHFVSTFTDQSVKDLALKIGWAAWRSRIAIVVLTRRPQFDDIYPFVSTCIR